MICNQEIPPLFPSHSFHQWLCPSDFETCLDPRQRLSRKRLESVCTQTDVNSEFSEELKLVI